MITLSGTHTCRRCGREYAWKDKELEHNEIARSINWDEARKNVRNATPIPATGRYTVEVYCPDCGCTEYEDAEPK